MTTKKDLKELKSPDEFQKLGQQAVPFLEQHGKNVVLGVLAFVGVGGIVALVSHVQKRANEAAMYEYGAALKVLDRQVSATAPADAPKDEDPPFKSDREKDEAIIAKLSGFRAEHKGRKSAAHAALPLAQAMLRQGKADDALKLAEEFLKDADPADPLRPVALEARGYALEQTGKLDEAAAAFEKLAQENKTDFLKGMGLYHHARILEKKNDLTGAMKRYGEVSSSAADSSAARLAKERMGLLAAKGVALPAAPAAAASDAGL
ncbi:MAG: tetratricopeptide repeat protein [Myxococcaceae bacterium]|jgi:tetratricopeptide (TPR) repeat protein|nr:tetratricopeptide repeat protein [Myxococcaceae bacterium]MCA3012664.1 tetratricopeptide repeat protein [Myxococcaceae bacterium]